MCRCRVKFFLCFAFNQVKSYSRPHLGSTQRVATFLTQSNTKLIQQSYLLLTAGLPLHHRHPPARFPPLFPSTVQTITFIKLIFTLHTINKMPAVLMLYPSCRLYRIKTFNRANVHSNETMSSSRDHLYTATEPLPPYITLI